MNDAVQNVEQGSTLVVFLRRRGLPALNTRFGECDRRILIESRRDTARQKNRRSAVALSPQRIAALERFVPVDRHPVRLSRQPLLDRSLRRDERRAPGPGILTRRLESEKHDKEKEREGTNGRTKPRSAPPLDTPSTAIRSGRRA